VSVRRHTPSPRRGEGWGEGARGSTLFAPVEPKQQFVSNCPQDAFGVRQHVIVPEPDEPVAEALDRCRSPSVYSLAVLPAIKLDDEVRGSTGKIRDVRPNLELADEFCAYETPASQVVPKMVLGVGAGPAKLSCDRGQSLFRQRRSPSPQPSPRRGEGATWRSSILVATTLALSACATPAVMHTEAQLNDVALGCGLALGELMQDESEKKLLLTVHQGPTPQQRVCVARWARRNGLKAVFVNMQFPAG